MDLRQLKHQQPNQHGRHHQQKQPEQVQQHQRQQIQRQQKGDHKEQHALPPLVCYHLSPLRPDLLVAVAFCENVKNMKHLYAARFSDAGPDTTIAAKTAPPAPTRTSESSEAAVASSLALPAAVAPAPFAGAAAAAALRDKPSAKTRIFEAATAIDDASLASSTAAGEAQTEATIAAGEIKHDTFSQCCCVGMNPSLVASVDQLLLGVVTAVEHMESGNMSTATLQKEILYCCSPGGRSIARSLQQLGLQPQQQHLLIVVLWLRQPLSSNRSNSEKGGIVQQQREGREAALLQQVLKQLETELHQWGEAQGTWRRDVEEAIKETRDEETLRKVASLYSAEEALPGGLEAAILARIATKFC